MALLAAACVKILSLTYCFPQENQEKKGIRKKKHKRGNSSPTLLEAILALRCKRVKNERRALVLLSLRQKSGTPSFRDDIDVAAEYLRSVEGPSWRSTNSFHSSSEAQRFEGQNTSLE